MTETSINNLKSPPMMLLDRITYHATITPHKTALNFLVGGANGGKIESKLSYSELCLKLNDLSNTLLEEGIQEGDRVVLVFPPSLDFVIAFLACLKVGIVAVPVFPPHPGRKETISMFSKIVVGCAAKHALTNSNYNHIKRLAGIKESLTLKKSMVKWPSELKWIITNVERKKQKSNKNKCSFKPSSSSLAFLQYTSGSTSSPKGVMITHENLSHNLTIITSELKADSSTIVVSWLPQYHDMGLIGSYLGALYCGGEGYYLSPLTFLQRPMVWMEAVSVYKATHLQAPNFAFKLTARKFDFCEGNSKYTLENLDLSSVCHIINAAEPVDEQSINVFIHAFGKFGLRREVIFPTYGLAEHTVFVCSGGNQIIKVEKEALEVDGVVNIFSQNDKHTLQHVSLVGCGYPKRQNVDVRIVDQNSSKELGGDKVGEIWVNSPSKAIGYYNKPQETELEFNAKLDNNNDNGYLRTGDLGFIHREELFICGRLKDLLIIGGRNHYPQDIEATAESTIDALRPGCSGAFGVPSQNTDLNEKVVLIMEMRDEPKTEKDVLRICKPIIEELHSTIKQEHSLDISHFLLLKPRTVPKTTSGKIARAWCRKAFLNGTLSVIYKISFTEDLMEKEKNYEYTEPLEIQSFSPNANNVRAMDETTIRSKLIIDIAKLTSISADTVDTEAPLIALMDSINLSQFKGMLEANYATKLSDEYLFFETTTVQKLVHVVKLGHAPDDSNLSQPETGTKGTGGHVLPNPSTGNAGGIAGALGCPPGVVCCTIM